MPNETKGITVKIDAALHAEVKKYLEEHNMTMGEFVTLALDDELHPKIQNTEEMSVGKMRTLAFQVPEDLFQRIKGYLTRTGMTQKNFIIGLIEEELDRDEDMRAAAQRTEAETDTEEYGEDNAPDETDEDITAISPESYGEGSEDSIRMEEKPELDAVEADDPAYSDNMEDEEEYGGDEETDEYEESYDAYDADDSDDEDYDEDSEEYDGEDDSEDYGDADIAEDYYVDRDEGYERDIFDDDDEFDRDNYDGDPDDEEDNDTEDEDEEETHSSAFVMSM